MWKSCATLISIASAVLLLLLLQADIPDGLWLPLHDGRVWWGPRAASQTGDGGAQAREWVPSTPQHTHEVVLFVHNALLPTTPDMPNITLVTHATLDRRPHAVRWCRQYRGPMSLSLYVRPGEDDADAVLASFLSDGCIRRHADVHMTREAPAPPSDDAIPRPAAAKDMMTHYPFNVQRNAAVKGCRGDLMLLVDIDFVMLPDDPQPKEARIRGHYWAQRSWMRGAWSPDMLGWGPPSGASATTALYERVLRRLAAPSSGSARSRYVSEFVAPSIDDVLNAAVFVIPAVESVHTNVSLPTSMEALRAAVEAHQVCSFYGHYCRTCHIPTELERFLRATHPYRVTYQEGYEPYVILNRSSVGRHFHITPAATTPPSATAASTPLATASRLPTVPSYDESFIGRGWDKMSFFYALEAQRRPFVVMSAGFFMGHRGRGDMPKVMTAEYKTRQVDNRDAMQRFKENTRRTYRAITARRVDARATIDDHEGDHRWLAYHLQSAPTALPLHDNPVVQAMSTILGRDVDLLVPLLEAQVPRLLRDPMLWNASCGGFDWSSYASSAQFPAVVNDPPSIAKASAASRRVSLTCIAKGRPASMLDPTAAHNNVRADVDAPVVGTRSLVEALTFVCGAGLNCSMLQLTSEQHDHKEGGGDHRTEQEGPSPTPLRGHPQSIYAHADYAMDRWFHDALRRGETPERACDFGGAAELVRFDPLVALRPRFVGCSIGPEAALDANRTRALLVQLCTGGRRDGAPEALDALTPEGCRAVVGHMQPMLRSNLRLQVSVLLTAHHLVYEAGGAGCTCACRFGSDVAWTHVGL